VISLEGALWLYAGHGDAGSTWSPEYRFVFSVPASA
jgi:hypothetical protein